MADVRINALATTATSSSSDDFIAIDGSANGTRKLSAYSPTFGGNLTVASQVLSGVSSGYGILSLNNSTSLSGASIGMFGGGAGDSNLYLNAPTGGTLDCRINNSSKLTVSATGMTVSGTGTSSVAGKLIAGSATADYAVSKLQSNGALVVYGGAITNAPDAPSIVIDQQVGGVARIMASGTSTWAVPLCLNPYGGNVLLGTTTDGGQKLQVAGTAYVSGSATLNNLTVASSASGFDIRNASSTAGLSAVYGGSAYNNGAGITLGGSTHSTYADTILFTTGAYVEAARITASAATFAVIIKPQQAATASAPSYVKGAIYFDTTLNKLRVGGATGWETITSV